MPIYEYQCDQCDKLTEAIQRLDEAPLELCPHCGGSLRKLMSAPAFQFKGSGWYVTDYADKGRKDGKGSAKASDGKTEGETKSSTSSDTGGATKEPAKTSSSGTTDSS